MPLFVNGEEVPQAALAQEAGSLLERFQQLPEEERRRNGFTEEVMRQRAVEWARENLIERTLLRQEALRNPEPVDPKAIEIARETLYKRFGGKEKLAEANVSEEMIETEAEVTAKLERLLSKIAATVKSPKSKEVAAYYRNHKEHWQVPESAHAAHIVKHVNEETTSKQAHEAILEAKKRLDAGESFEALADEDQTSDCPGNGGDLGWFPRGKMVADFEEVVFQMEPGQISEPFRSVFGYHIAKLHDRKPAAMKPLSEVKEIVERRMRQERETKAIEAHVDDLRAKASVEFKEEPEAAAQS